MKINTRGNWKLWWGAMPLPQGATAVGTVQRDTGEEGALIEMPTGIYVQGNAGGTRSLPQRDVVLRLHLAKIGSSGGSKSSPAKRRTSKRNGRKGGRPEQGES